MDFRLRRIVRSGIRPVLEFILGLLHLYEKVTLITHQYQFLRVDGLLQNHNKHILYLRPNV